jgi:hypothetical protein
MTFDDLMRAILNILPNAQLGEDNDGQIVVYTNKKMHGENLSEMGSPEVVATVCNCAQCEGYRR